MNPVFQPQQDVDVGETTLLPLTRTHVGTRIPEHSIFHQKVLQSLCLQPEDSGNEILAVMATLTWQQILLDFWPIWVAREGTKQVRTPKVAGITKTILKKV